MKVVIYVVEYTKINEIKKIKLKDNVIIDIFPEVQKVIFDNVQREDTSTEAGGLLIGYENINTSNISITLATQPQNDDKRTRYTLKLSKEHIAISEQLEWPYGYMGTWHTHPSNSPTPSFIDHKDWKQCIKENANKTNYLIFIIAGKCGFKVWLGDCKTGKIIEGEY